MIFKHIIKAVLVLSPLFGIQAVQASLVSCPSAFTDSAAPRVFGVTADGDVTAVSACQYLGGSSPGTPAKVENINAAGFFGHADWVANAGNLQVNDGGKDGTWAISGADFSANDYMIVFKSGNNTNLIGFLLNEQFASGDWFTPFTSAAFNVRNPKDVSHFTIVQRANALPPAEVPEPGALGLLAIGLTGFGAARRRARKA